MSVTACARVLRGPGVHDAGSGGAGAAAAVVMVHPEVVTELVSHDGGKRVHSVVDELREKQKKHIFYF